MLSTEMQSVFFSRLDEGVAILATVIRDVARMRTDGRERGRDAKTALEYAFQQIEGMIADERDARSSRETRIERIQSTVDEVLGHITELKREERAGRVKRAHLELDRREVDLEALDEEIRIGIDKLQRV